MSLLINFLAVQYIVLSVIMGAVFANHKKADYSPLVNFLGGVWFALAWPGILTAKAILSVVRFKQ